MSDTIADRVARGAALLDWERPGWWREVNPGQIDMTSCVLCVLGQLYGDFFLGCDRLGFKHGRSCGFNAKSPWELRELRAEWTRIITARREAESCSC